jgi:hypothetical protein
MMRSLRERTLGIYVLNSLETEQNEKGFEIFPTSQTLQRNVDPGLGNQIIARDGG